MNNIGFIIPTYPPHYNFLNFLNSLNDINFDIILILSFKSDYNELLQYNYKKIYKTIVLENYLTISDINLFINKQIIITFKKYFALNLLKNDYTYCATIDSEIEFVNTKNIFEKFEKYCSNKKIISSLINTNDYRHELIKNINTNSAIFFENTKYYENLKEVTKNFNFYFWFSDIPIYNMSYITDFFYFIGFNNLNNFCDKLNWYIFDYIPYVYFIILFKDYKIVNIKDYGLTREWSLESMPFKTYKNVINNINYKPLWLIQNTYDENKEDIDIANDIILIYHRNDGRYNFVND